MECWIDIFRIRGLGCLWGWDVRSFVLVPGGAVVVVGVGGIL